jgi:DNA-binding response OmpR family regulator
VQVATTCAQARVLYEQDQPDGVLLDIQLPDGNGLALCQSFKSLVCLISGLPPAALAEALQSSGAQSYLQKPILLPQLDELLRAWQHSMH